jgi:uncharacterized protein with HEPN domain
MPHDPKVLLEDIRMAAEEIRKHTTGRSLVDYQTDQLLRAGVERWFIVIGEALTRLEKLDASWSGKISDFRQIVGFRNVLVHGYEVIDDAIVWKTLQDYLPILLGEVAAHIAALSPPQEQS